MKKATIALVIILLSISFNAKSAEITGGLIFPDFQLGKVYFKNTSIIDAYLNYHIVNKQMIFKNKDEVLALGLVQTVDSIVISGRVFVYHEDEEFLEKIPVGKGFVYIQYIATLLTKSKEAGFGGYSQLSNTKSLSSLSDNGESGGRVELTAKELLDAKISTTFWIKNKNNFSKLTSKNQVLNTFSKNKALIQSYFDTHKVNFEILSDVKDLFTYCYSL